MTAEIFKTGHKPGKGRYVCVACKEDLYLDDDTDRLPPCACKGVEFTREDRPAPKAQKPKPAKDQIKISAQEGGRFSSNRDGVHIDFTLDKGENIITKAQYELCKDAPGIKKQ